MFEQLRSTVLALVLVGVAALPAAAGARTMALDPRTHTLYTVTAQFEPQPADSTNGRRRPPMVPGSFTMYVLRR